MPSPTRTPVVPRAGAEAPISAGDRVVAGGGWPAGGGEPGCDHLRRQLHRLLVDEGGFTVDPTHGRPVRWGWAVTADPSCSVSLPLAGWSGPVGMAWLVHARGRAAGSAASAGGRLHLGGWYRRDRDRVHLDLVHVADPDDEDWVQWIGHRHRQRAVFDLGRRMLVPVRESS